MICLFQINDSHTSGEFEEHVLMHLVTAIPFKSCRFQSLKDPTYEDFQSLAYTGIHSIDSDFSVTRLCESNDDPCTTWGGLPQFSGLLFGIRAYMTSGFDYSLSSRSLFI